VRTQNQTAPGAIISKKKINSKNPGKKIPKKIHLGPHDLTSVSMLARH
jgi:hypothetical protein